MADELTLPAYQAMTGDENATAEDLAAHLTLQNAAPATDAPPAEPPPADSPPAATTEWKHPEKWEDHYYDRKALDELDPHTALADEANPFHKLVKRVYGDPQRDEHHPFHKQASDLRSQMAKAAEEARQERGRRELLEKELTDNLSKPLVDTDNNPDLARFGGIQPSDQSETGYSNAKGEDVPFWKYQTAINAYERFESERANSFKSREDRQRAERDAFTAGVKELDDEYAKVKGKFTDAEPEQLFKQFSPYTRDGAPNPEFKGITAVESYQVSKYLRGEGGIEGAIARAQATAVESFKQELVKKGMRLEDIPAGTSLTNTNTQPIKAVPVVKTSLTAKEIEDLPDDEYKVRFERGDFKHLESPTPVW